MSTSERLEGWRNTALPYIKKKLELDPHYKVENSAEATDVAFNAFEEARAKIERYRNTHSGEDAEMQHATMAHFFEEIGVLPLDAVRMVEELYP